MYVAADLPPGDLAGFFCFGTAAQVPGGRFCGVYDDVETLDVGLGLRPDLTGRGLGLSFVRAGLDSATERFGPAALRLTVAVFNRRAVTVYERAGFQPIRQFNSHTTQGVTDFLLMLRKA